MRNLFPMILIIGCWTVAAAGAAPGDAAPAQDAELRRELRIGADVLRAALAESLPEQHRVVAVEAGLLARQGVLVVVDLAQPWLRHRGRELRIGREIISLEQLPAMVQDILDELNVGLSREQAEDLQELRAIRDATRAARAEQRRLRAELREKRRALLKTPGDAALREQIDTLQAALNAAEEEERALAADADLARDALETAVTAASPGDAATAGLDRAVAETVCGYGATFRSLENGLHLNVVVRGDRGSRYYAFAADRVRDCQKGGITAEDLLGSASVYEG